MIPKHVDWRGPSLRAGGYPSTHAPVPLDPVQHQQLMLSNMLLFLGLMMLILGLLALGGWLYETWLQARERRLADRVLQMLRRRGGA